MTTVGRVEVLQCQHKNEQWPVKKISSALYSMVNFIFTVLGLKFSLQLGNMQHCELLIGIITGRIDPTDAGSPAKQTYGRFILNKIRSKCPYI